MNIDIIDDYIEQNDWRVSENSNTNFCFGGLQGYIADKLISKYVLEKHYKGKISEAHRRNFIHIHDLGHGLTAYCHGSSIEDVLKEGLNADNRFSYAKPAKHFMVACSHIYNYLFTLSQEWAGAQSFSSVDTYLAPFVKEDNLSYEQIKQYLQHTVFELNNKYRIAMQSPFSNLSYDLVVPKDMKYKKVIVGGKELDYTYADCQKEMNMINIAFLEIMLEGDGMGKPFTFPIPTYNITKNFDWESDVSNKLFEVVGKTGLPYLANYINSDLDPSDVRSMAILGTQELIYKNGNGIISKNSIKKLFECWKGERGQFQVLMNGKFIDIIDMFEVPYTNYDKYVKFTLKNNYIQNFSWQHKCKIVRDNKIIEVESQEVKVTDKCLISLKGYNKSNIGTYEAGLIVGYYIGEGWKTHGNEINFAINIDRMDIVTNIKDYFLKLGCNVKVIKNHENKNINKVFVYGKQAKGFVEEFIKGDKAKEKRLDNKIWNTSLDFRKGVIEGLYDTDGYKPDKLLFHTTNKYLCYDLITLCNSVGFVVSLQINANNTRYFKQDKSDLIKFTSYKLRFLLNYEVIKYKGDDYALIPIQDIKYPNYRSNKVYNFTVDTDDHLYELPNGIITHQCCRLNLRLDEIRKNSNGLFGSADKTGSLGVITLNLSRIGYMSRRIAYDNKCYSQLLSGFDELNDEIEKLKINIQDNPEELMISIFYAMIFYFMDIGKESFIVKRKMVEEFYNMRFYPYTKRYLDDYTNHFNTFGVNAGNECLLNMFDIDIMSEKGKTFMEGLLQKMLDKLGEYQVEYKDYYKRKKKGLLFNLEATPAEGTGSKFAIHDLKTFGNSIKTANGKQLKYYTNSTQVPQDMTDNIFDVLDNQDKLQTLYSSGTVLHIYLNQPIQSVETTKSLVKKIFSNYKLPYISIAPNLCICPIHGKLDKTYDYCPYDHTEEEIEEIKKKGAIVKDGKVIFH
jgi:anaerobic ribonucleoside-triphosphate reductase